MQKIINVIALLSGLTSLTVIGGGVYLYKNADVMMEEARGKLSAAAVEAVSGALPGLIDSAMPNMPEVTGPALPKVSGPAIPF